jgi:hypothetical protein
MQFDFGSLNVNEVMGYVSGCTNTYMQRDVFIPITTYDYYSKVNSNVCSFNLDLGYVHACDEMKSSYFFFIPDISVQKFVSSTELNVVLNSFRGPWLTCHFQAQPPPGQGQNGAEEKSISQVFNESPANALRWCVGAHGTVFTHRHVRLANQRPTVGGAYLHI